MMRFYSNGRAAASPAYTRPDLQQQSSQSVVYDIIRQNSDNEASSSSFQTTAAVNARPSAERVYSVVDNDKSKKSQRGAAKSGNRQSYANLPCEQSAQQVSSLHLSLNTPVSATFNFGKCGPT